MEYLAALAGKILGAVERLWDSLSSMVGKMGMEGWVLALGGIIVMAFLCMRGFGSRSNW